MSETFDKRPSTKHQSVQILRPIWFRKYRADYKSGLWPNAISLEVPNSRRSEAAQCAGSPTWVAEAKQRSEET